MTVAALKSDTKIAGYTPALPVQPCDDAGRDVAIMAGLTGQRRLPIDLATKLYDTMPLRPPTIADRLRYSVKARRRMNGDGVFVVEYKSKSGNSLGFTRVRLTDGLEPKYLSQAGLPPHAYFYPGLDWPTVADETSKDVIVTEGELKASVACEFGYNCLGLGGTWSFKSAKSGSHYLLPELEEPQFMWRGRKVVVVFDSDVSEKVGVKASLHALARALAKLGARVVTKLLPSGPNGEKVGLDDFLVRSSKAAFDALPELPFKEIEELAALNDQLVHILNQDEYFEISTGVRRDDRKLKSRFLSRRMPFVNAAGVTEDRSAIDEWLKWSEHRTAPDYDFSPQEGPITTAGNVNLFRGLPVVPVKGDVTLWHSLMDHVFDASEEGLRARRWFECWVSYKFQNLGVKQFVAVLLWSPLHGCGKSLLGEILCELYGDDYSKEVTAQQLHGSFNSWQDRTLLAFCNEITISNDKRGNSNHFKNLLTQHKANINLKFKNEVSYLDRTSYLFTSNYADAMFIPSSDRRLFVWRLDSILPEEKGSEIAAWIRTDAGRASLLHYFLNDVDTCDFRPHERAPMTKAKEEMIKEGLSSLESFVMQLVEDPEERDLISVAQLLAAYDPCGYRKTTEKAARRALRAAHCDYLDVSVRVKDGNPAKQRPWVLRDFGKWSRASYDELKSELNARQQGFKKQKF